MNVTLHEVARVLAIRNDISQFEDFDLQKPEFDSRLIGRGTSLSLSRGRVMGMILLKPPLKMGL